MKQVRVDTARWKKLFSRSRRDGSINSVHAALLAQTIEQLCVFIMQTCMIDSCQSTCIHHIVQCIRMKVCSQSQTWVFFSVKVEWILMTVWFNCTKVFRPAPNSSMSVLWPAVEVPDLTYVLFMNGGLQHVHKQNPFLIAQANTSEDSVSQGYCNVFSSSAKSDWNCNFVPSWSSVKMASRWDAT